MTQLLTAGLGLKAPHYAEAANCDAQGLWFEVHPENYMATGGPRLAWLERIGERRPLSFHGVALSLAADADPDPAHLGRLKRMVDRFQPALVSEHLAWSTWRGAYHPDLLPFPRTNGALTRIAANVQRTQETLGRAIAVENPSHYLPIEGHEWDEVAFLIELCRRTGCGLLLDVNNVFVSANNLGTSSEAYIDSIPAALVREIHLAGHAEDPGLGAALLIDSHDAPVSRLVWSLYERLVGRIGPRPTLIERDDALPAFADLLGERDRAHAILTAERRKAA